MNNEQAQELWAQGLEATEHVQGKGRMQDGNRYCCLGIGCLIAEQNGVFVERWDDTGNIMGYDLRSQPAVREWLGLNSNIGSNAYSNGITLVGLNDYKGKTFPAIAAIIRSKPKGLFIC